MLLLLPTIPFGTPRLQGVLQRHYIEVVGLRIPAQKPVRVTAPVHEPRREIEVVPLHPERRSCLSPEPNDPHRDKANRRTCVSERTEIHAEIVMIKRPFLVWDVPLDGDGSIEVVDYTGADGGRRRPQQYQVQTAAQGLATRQWAPRDPRLHHVSPRQPPTDTT
jgi:hypothetical protein